MAGLDFLTKHRFITFIWEDAQGNRAVLLLCGIVGGVFQAVSVLIINSSSVLGDSKIDMAEKTPYLLLFIAAIAISSIARTVMLQKAQRIVSQGILRIRNRIANKLRNADVLWLHNADIARIEHGLSSDCVAIANATGPVFSALSAIVMLLVCFLYVASFSLITAVATAVSLFLMARATRKHIAKVMERLGQAAVYESKHLSMVEQIFLGLKELKMSRARKDAFFENLKSMSDGAAAQKIEAGKTLSTMIVFQEASYYLVVAVVLFVLPALAVTTEQEATRVVALLLFASVALWQFLGATWVLPEADRALQNIAEVELLIQPDPADAVWAAPPRPASNEEPTVFTPPPMRLENAITLEGVSFTFPDALGESGFHIGPIDLEVRRGELLCITGGNGSGKSTLMKVLAGLYYPQAGKVTVDGTPVGLANMASYRQLFSILFVEFHLFSRFYGMEVPDPDRIQEMIAYMQLSEHTTFVQDHFSRLNLSTGQRKRLALIASLLEDRPVMLLDEVAADQDIEFRAHFYDTIIPGLISAGKTIVLVSHDDRYFDRADRLIKMDFGQVVTS